MTPKRLIAAFGILGFALFVALPFGYQAVTGQPIGANTLILTDAPSGGTPAVRASGRDANISVNIVPKGTGSVLVSGVPIITGGGTTTSLTINPGPLNVTGTTNLTGPLFVQPGTNGTLKSPPLVVFHNITDVGNTAAVTEDTLHTFTVPANTLTADGQWLRWQTAIVMAANADTKRTRAYFGATVIGDTTAVAFNNQSFVITCDVYRTGAATQKAYCYTGSIPTTAAAWGSGGAGTTGGFNTTTPAEALNGAVVMKITGQAGAANANDIVAKATTVRWFPAGQ